MTKYLTLRGALTATLAAMLTSTAQPSTAAPDETAKQCILAHGLQSKIGDGNTRIYVNDVFLRQDAGPSSTSGTFTEWLVEGKNVIRIEFGGNVGSFAITQGCRDAMPEAGFVDAVAFDAPGTKTLGFTHDYPVTAEYLKAEIAGEEGLAQAITAFQKAAREKDLDAIFELQAPLFREAESQGYPVKMAQAFASEVVTRGTAEIAEEYSITPVLGGRVYQVLDAGMKSPVRVVLTDEEGSYSWSSGTYWARFNGKWGVVAM